MSLPHLVASRKVRLKQISTDPPEGIEKDEAKERTAELARALGDFQEVLYADSKQSLLLIFQGMDASGKDGSIRNLLSHVNPAGVETTSFKQPSVEERAHDYLWRIHRAVPRAGMIGVFNRSQYEAVLAERVLGIVTPKVCVERYGQIVDFERMLAANGVVILKFYLHLSRKEQASRFEERLDNPRKNWKFSKDDLVTRSHWKAYMNAYEETLRATSHAAAPWYIIPADHKWYRDAVVAEIVGHVTRKLNLKWPKPKPSLARIHIR